MQEGENKTMEQPEEPAAGTSAGTSARDRPEIRDFFALLDADAKAIRGQYFTFFGDIISWFQFHTRFIH